MPDSRCAEYDAVIVGAGFSGLYMLHRLKQQGLRARVLERGDGVGGTWFWNRYPGARCDIESMEYSYQFSEALQQSWEWSERYASQPEILSYINHVADRFGLREDIQLETTVTGAEFDSASNHWCVHTQAGDTFSSRYCIMATGCLSSANTPDFPGLASFQGDCYHTGNWPQEGVDFSGKRVAVIGTGSSGIQSIPLIAEQARHLTVFQRTPNYSVPARNKPLDPDYVRAIKADYSGFRAHNWAQPFGANFQGNDALAAEADADTLQQEYQARWQRGGLPFMAAFADLLFDRKANDTAAEFIRQKIREQVADPETAQKLCPDSVVGCKRLCADSNYFETYNRPDVTLVDVSEAPIEAITADGLRTSQQQYALDCIVFATGFDAMTGALMNIDITGTQGHSLAEKWNAGPRTYLGLATSGFPNLFMITGPGSPSVLTNMLPSIEQHVNWIADCIEYMQQHDFTRINATETAQEQWVQHVNDVAGETLYPSCNSWYLGANVPGKPRVFMPYLGFPPYVEKCEAVVANGYEGFELSRDLSGLKPAGMNGSKSYRRGSD